VGLADIAGIDLDAGSLGWRDNQIGALLTRFAGAVPDKQRQLGVRLAIQQFMHQLHPEKASGAGDKDEFFVIHSETNLNDRTTRRKVNDDLWVPEHWKKQCAIIPGAHAWGASLCTGPQVRVAG
jgi:hypothetical protein